MTIANLLGHFGTHVPRYVTLDGQVVRDVLSTAGGAVHATLGRATAVTPHTFHGGVESDVLDHPPVNNAGAVVAGPATVQSVAAPARQRPGAWFMDPVQVDRHRRAMHEALPGFAELPSEGTMPAWTGIINTGRGRFEVTVATRSDGGLPRLIPGRPRRLGKSRAGLWYPAPHLYTNGNLCVADEIDWDPDLHTVATAAMWAAHWYAAYTEWLMTDRWPQAGYSPH